MMGLKKKVTPALNMAMFMPFLVSMLNFSGVRGVFNFCVDVRWEVIFRAF